MASRIVAAARQAATVSRFSAAQKPSLLLHRRTFAGAADPHGTLKVNCWQDPMSPSKWKEEHAFRRHHLVPCKPPLFTRGRRDTLMVRFWRLEPGTSQFLPLLGFEVAPYSLFVIVSLTGWGLAIYGGFKLFSGGKKEEKKVETAQ